MHSYEIYVTRWFSVQWWGANEKNWILDLVVF